MLNWFSRLKTTKNNQDAALLSNMPVGSLCRIEVIHNQGAIRQRLFDLGIRPQRVVRVLRYAPLFDPIELQVGDSFISLRHAEACQIEVALLAEQPEAETSFCRPGVAHD